MKKSDSIFIIALIIALFLPIIAYANMAAPAEPDIVSSITFEKNDYISVLSEVLDITVKGSQADIVVTYKMKNTLNKNISTQTMFLSPNIETGNVNVIVNKKDVSFTVKSYALSYDTKIETTDWQYAVLTDSEIADHNDGQVDSITFNMDFSANEEYDVIVSYSYKLGGYPDYDFNVKEGIIEYYLTPAVMWKDFSSLNINLYLDEDMPVIKDSSLDFKKIDARAYQYTSDTLPQENLRIVIDENWWQNIFSSLKSPYLSISLMMFSPLILIITGIVIVIVIIVWRVRKKKKASISRLL